MARRTISVVASLAALMLALFVVTAGPALAGNGKDKDKGGATGGSGYTEDNDTNDGNTPNNVSDDGDNAHPSGKDRSVENGKSGNQGKSGSDPDGDANGGPDKANGSGGVDSADQDGNNGCGNDDDFEDDNNGNCGPKEKDKVKGTSCSKAKGKGKGRDKKCTAPTEPTCPVKMTDATKSCDEAPDEVAGDAVTDCPKAAEMSGSTCDEAVVDDDVLGSTTDASGDVSGEGDDVLGTTITNDEDGGTEVAAEREAAGGTALPFTGAAILSLVALAVGLVGSGYLFLRRDRS